MLGIIAEYDPFHNGHAWQLARARALGGGQPVAVALSCGLTQRGAVPLLPERVRVQAALACGADLVFALPAPYACAGAEAFARAGVSLLAAAGCSGLVFGAETPDAGRLLQAARVLAGEDYRTALKAALAAGARSFAAARQAAVEAAAPGTGLAELLDKPNNNLAIEYCKAILQLGAAMTPIPLPRRGANHGEALNGSARFASASALRALWAEGGAPAIRPFVPEAVYPLYAEADAAGAFTDFAAAGRCELALLRAQCGPFAEKPFAHTRGVSEGLDHALRRAVQGSATQEELLDALTTVRYPRARMRRLAMDAALGHTDALPPLPPYLQLLGGRRALLPALKAAALPVSHSLMRLREANADCAAAAAAQCAASDFAALVRKTPEAMGSALTRKAVFL
mgnify:FL=1